MTDDLKDNVREKSTWMRALYMLLFAIIYSVSEIVLTAVVIFQFFTVLFTRKANERLLKLGQSLATFIYQIIQYLTFISDDRPYPFGAWPRGVPPTGKIRKKITSDEAEPAEVSEAPKTTE